MDFGDTVDVVVVGPGAAGYSPAITAREHGPDDLQPEKARRGGGALRRDRDGRVLDQSGAAAGAPLGPYLTNGYVIGRTVAAAEPHRATRQEK